MGQRGPKPKPAALKILAGNPGKRPIAAGKSQGIAKGVPPRPPELTGVAAEEWDRIAGELHAAGLLAVTDGAILTAFCFAVADMLACRAAVAEHGRFASQPIQNSAGAVISTRWVEHPAVARGAEAARRVAMLAAELRLTPAARERLEGGAIQAEAAPENRVVAIRERIQARRAGS